MSCLGYPELADFSRMAVQGSSLLVFERLSPQNYLGFVVWICSSYQASIDLNVALTQCPCVTASEFHVSIPKFQLFTA